MKSLIHLALQPKRLPENSVERLRAIDGSREIFASEDRAEIEARLDDIEIAAGDFPPDLAVRASNLKWMQLWSAGADWLQTLPEARSKDFLLTTTSGMHVGQMAEHLFALILAWGRKLPDAFDAQRRGEWHRPHRPALLSLAGKTMLIVGFGAIGEGVARAAAAFGMRVVGVVRTPRSGPERTDGVRLALMAELPALMGEADIVVNILPYTQETRGLFGKELFGRMKKTALFANIGRGPTVNEAELIAALESKTIAGALLDVMETEPLPSDSPLWKRNDVILTAHYAGFHPEYDRIAFDIFLDNFERFAKGKALLNLVDKNRGY